MKPPEEVLVGDVGHRLVFFLNFDAFLGFNRLVEAIGEAPAFHYPPGKGVHDQDFPIVNHVVLVQEHDVISPQGLVQVVGQGGVFRVVEVL